MKIKIDFYMKRYRIALWYLTKKTENRISISKYMGRRENNTEESKLKVNVAAENNKNPNLCAS